MDSVTVGPSGPVLKDLRVPGDKSISHRALMFSALADGSSRISGLQTGHDVLSTRSALEALGISICGGVDCVIVEGRGLKGFKEATDVIHCGNSGTTMRLMAGVLAGQDFFSILTGDGSLLTRPMARVLNPLREMGAVVAGRESDAKAPFSLRGGKLTGLTWKSPVASAQVKSAVLLAGLNANGSTFIEEPALSRDHTERMLAAMGCEILRENCRVGLVGGSSLRAVDFDVPGDPSSAAFWVAAALMVPGSKVCVRNVSLNPTRIGFFQILQRMGAPVEMIVKSEQCGEPVGDICVEYGELQGVVVSPEEVPSAIDEFPVLCVVAALAGGETEIRGAEELRHKESDRIGAVAWELEKAGAQVQTFADGICISGGKPLHSARFNSRGDHRLAMAFGVLSLALKGGGVIEDAGAAAVSYPGFWKELSIG